MPDRLYLVIVHHSQNPLLKIFVLIHHINELLLVVPVIALMHL